MAYRLTDMETVDIYEALSNADTLVKGVMQADTEVKTVLSWGDLAAIKLLASKEMKRKRRIAKETDKRMHLASKIAEAMSDPKVLDLQKKYKTISPERAVARAAGIEAPTMALIMRGMEKPDVWQLQGIARALGKPMEAFLDEDH